MRSDGVAFLSHVADKYSVDRVVHIGDLVDWNSISYHEKRPTLPSPATEYMDAMEQVAMLAEVFDTVDWLFGNHDDLPNRKCITSMLDPEWLKDPHSLYKVPDTWTVHPRFSSLEIDGVLYRHGDAGSGGQYAHVNQAKANFQSTVIGHFHANAGAEFIANSRDRIFGMAVGCLADTHKEQFHYGKRYPRKPINGCGVVIDGHTPIFVPMLLGARWPA